MSDIRNSIRDKIFTAKPEGRVIEVFGTKIELRQPSVADVLDSQQLEDRKEQVAQMLIRFAYVPGTNEKVFEFSDADALMTLPFNADFQQVQNVIASLIGAAVTDDTKSGTETTAAPVGRDADQLRTGSVGEGGDNVDTSGHSQVEDVLCGEGGAGESPAGPAAEDEGPVTEATPALPDPAPEPETCDVLPPEEDADSDTLRP